MSRKSKFYSEGPTAPSSKKADSVPPQSPSLGNDVPNVVPPKPGRSTAFGATPATPHALSHGRGSGVIRSLGTLRESGHPKAHRIGRK